MLLELSHSGSHISSICLVGFDNLFRIWNVLTQRLVLLIVVGDNEILLKQSIVNLRPYRRPKQ